MKSTKEQVKAQFDTVLRTGRIPIFEVNLGDYDGGPDRYNYCYIRYNEITDTLEYGGTTNTGFICRNSIKYDHDFDLDSNLSALLETFILDLFKQELEEQVSASNRIN
jgi:hypothetical protein